VKRPRSTTPTKGDSPAKKKSKSIKKPKKSKGPKSGTSDGTVPTLKKSSTPSTATADGQMMAQMLSTFSKMEQSRFEAFQRSALPQNTVQDWLVACLYRKGPTGHPSVARDAAASATASPSHHRLQLDDLVAPGQASDISMVVATVAKIYAQRLVATAKKLQKKRIIATDDEDADDNAEDNDTDKEKGGDQEEPAKRKTGTGGANKSAIHTDDHENRPLEPQDIWCAWQYRCQRGLDPGFFLSSTSQSTASNGGDGGWNINLQQEGSIDDMDDYTQRRLAALAAQEEYEKRLSASMAEKGDQEAKVDGEAMDIDPSDN